jgi:hypothetical protein
VEPSIVRLVVVILFLVLDLERSEGSWQRLPACLDSGVLDMGVSWTGHMTGLGPSSGLLGRFSDKGSWTVYSEPWLLAVFRAGAKKSRGFGGQLPRRGARVPWAVASWFPGEEEERKNTGGHPRSWFPPHGLAVRSESKSCGDVFGRKHSRNFHSQRTWSVVEVLESRVAVHCSSRQFVQSRERMFLPNDHSLLSKRSRLFGLTT